MSGNTCHHVCFLITRSRFSHRDWCLGLVAFTLIRSTQTFRRFSILRQDEKASIEKSIEFESIIPTAFTIFERTIEHAIYNKTKIIQMLSSYIYAATAYLNGGQAEAMGKPPSNDERTSRNSDAHFLPTVLASIKLAGVRRERTHTFGDVEPKDEDLEMAENGFNTWYFEDEETGELIPSWKWPEMVSRYRDS